MTTPNTTGTCVFRLNGQQVAIAGDDFTIMALEEKKNVLISMDGTKRYQREYQSPMIECNVSELGAEVDLFALTQLENAVVTVELANGTSYEISGAHYTGDGNLNVKDGSFQMRFNGDRIRRLTP